MPALACGFSLRVGEGWMTTSLFRLISIQFLISYSSCPLSKPLGTVPSASYNFLIFWQGVSICLSFRFLNFHSGPRRRQHPLYGNFFFFLLIISEPRCLAGFRGSICVSKSQRILCILFSRTDSRLCIYHLATPVDAIKDQVRSSVKVSEFDKHLKKTGGHIGWNFVEITTNNCPKTLNDKNHQASSQKFKQLLSFRLDFV